MGLVLLILAGWILSFPAFAAQAVDPVQILAHTPLYVWALLALLVYLGLGARKSRDVPILRLTQLPIAFALWGMSGVAQRFMGAPTQGVVWLFLAAAGVILYRLGPGRRPWPIDPATRLVHRPGSWAPLASNLAIFAVKYVATVAIIIRPAERPALVLLDVGFSGLLAGYFFARLASLLMLYRRSQPVVEATGGGV